MDRDENAAINVLHKALTAVGLTVAAYRRLSGCTPDEVGMPDCEVGKLSLYSEELATEDVTGAKIKFQF